VHRRNLIISIVVILISILIFVLLLKSGVEYSTFEEAKSTGKKVQVIGIVLKQYKTDYKGGVFEFYMSDGNTSPVKVIYKGAIPQSFDIAEKIVVKGIMRDNYFECSEILTKCPSKYENK